MSDHFAACRAMMSDRTYLLSSLVPFRRDAGGRVWIGDRWHRDLMTHLAYLPNMLILAVEVDDLGDEHQFPVEPDPGQSIDFITTGPVMTSRRQVPRHAPGMIRAMRQGLAQADVVHSGVAGWPVPPGVFLNPMTLRRGLPLVINIEGAFWRVPEGTEASARRRAEAALTERFARWSCARARLAVYTHRSYAESLPVGPDGISAVTPASWIRQEDVVSEAELQQSWDEKSADLRLLLASRLAVQKGTDVVLEALKALEADGIAARLDIIGKGTMEAELAEFAAHARHVRVNMLREVAYATEFLPLLRGYHAVLVPTTNDEQPRIILDAFSQGVPVIASDTPGNREVAANGVNAVFVPRGDAAALARCISDPALTPARLRGLAGAARVQAESCTHEMMHQRRAGLLVRALDGRMPRRAKGSGQ
ncbi:glycosyltransferase family 4 protein [Paracoccus marinaquae]|uniref:Glycosyltransferase family 4 protein n=1 Tax=Paracoccus marinaquae TaxID=2841926 RepID=A0ABS6AL50_9RHOB|nr:glycosyltransferase [Paracoccus marinaquae]MBU3031219.1 glycosyltransferase family 4 protein [Paracoccus marinaquae]